MERCPCGTTIHAAKSGPAPSRVASHLEERLCKAVPATRSQAPTSALGILLALSLSHMLNDSIQALIPAVYPLFKQTFGLTFTEIGLITLTFQMTGSIFQPLVGMYTDHRPKPYSLAVGMGITLIGLILLALAGSYPIILLAAGTIGFGLGHFSSRIVPDGALGSGGRTALHSRSSSGRQRRDGAGPALGRMDCRAARATLILVFTNPGLLWNCHPFPDRDLVRHRRYATQTEIKVSRVGSSPPEPRRDCLVHVSPAGIDVFEVLLFGVHDQLLHLLSDE